MIAKLVVQVSERTGLAYARVPGNAMWELVEYLGIQRTQVHYGYSEDGFIVTFLRLGKDAAQGLLDAWNEAWRNDLAREYQEAQVEGRRGIYSLAG
jgi:hypothetical protein